MTTTALPSPPRQTPGVRPAPRLSWRTRPPSQPTRPPAPWATPSEEEAAREALEANPMRWAGYAHPPLGHVAEAAEAAAERARQRRPARRPSKPIPPKRRQQ